MGGDRISEQGSRRGLCDEEIKRSAEEYGVNRLSVGKRKSFVRHFLSNLGDPVIKILLCALCVNLIFVFKGGDIVETVGIAISVFLAAFISTISERGSEAAFRRLSEECVRAEYRVRRNGRIESVSIEDIVVGDVVLLSAGEQIPADAFVVYGRLGVDQSSMTGENREIEKIPYGDKIRRPDSKSAIFRGSVILSGEGEAQIFAVGDSTFLGEISREIQETTRESPLKIRLSKLARQISRLGYIAAFLVAAAYFLNSLIGDSGFQSEVILSKLTDKVYMVQNLLHAFMLGLTVIVVAVPEGLPMMIAVVLSSNIRRMIKDNVLVRKPVGIEAAGSMNILFTDKTGTLTEGKMSVGRLILGNGDEYTGYSDLKKRGRGCADHYRISCVCNTDTYSDSEKRIVGGNGTDKALAMSLGHDYFYSGKLQVLDKNAFDSKKKYSSVTVIDGKRRRFFVKGAPEKLIGDVVAYYDPDGKRVPFEKRDRELLEKGVARYSSSGERVLLICESDNEYIERASYLTVISAVTISDRVRRDARRSVDELRGAGIRVVMITGDGKNTASNIAEKCGILRGGIDRVISGEEMEKMSDAELKDILPRLAVVSRALPSDKSRLVRVAQELELVVGMTGDGINDAPALKKADIGFSMGSGTGVAKDAGDIIILDNRLSSIARAVLYGRNIFKSIRKFITLQLTMNFSAVGVSMIGPFVGFEAPVTVVQMLWINIIMDTLGGLAFAGEAPLESCMKESPKRRDEPILNGYMINQILVLGGFTIALCLSLLLVPDISGVFRFSENDLVLLTAFFALFIFTSVFNCFNARSDRLKLFSGLRGNRAFIIIMSAVCVIQVAFVYLGGEVLRTVPLTAREMCFTMLLALTVFPADLIRKSIRRIFGKKGGF